MLQPIMHQLAKKRIILASSSPRRKEILSNIGLEFEVCPSDFEENLNKANFSNPVDYVAETARMKTMSVAHKFANDSPQPDLIIGADTVLTMDGEIFEKPRNDEHAFEVLSRFSGRSHTVITSVTLLTPKRGPGDGREFNVVQFHEETLVNFAQLSPQTIKAYLQTGEHRDKAGGYGIQAIGGTLIKSINGDYFNVKGFPLHKFAVELLKIFPMNNN